MKRCPTCNQEFSQDWLTFCTNDGTSLVVIDPLSEEPPVTLVKDMPPSVSPLEQPTLDMPGSSGSSPAPYSPPAIPQPGWSVPPPPAYPKGKQQSLSIASLVLGIVSMTIGWCCYLGVLTSPVAIALGLYSLSQIKKNPEQYGGKGMAIGGIVAGSVYFVFLALIILVYGLSFLISGVR